MALEVAQFSKFLSWWFSFFPSPTPHHQHILPRYFSLTRFLSVLVFDCTSAHGAGYSWPDGLDITKARSPTEKALSQVTISLRRRVLFSQLCRDCSTQFVISPCRSQYSEFMDEENFRHDRQTNFHFPPNRICCVSDEVTRWINKWAKLSEKETSQSSAFSLCVSVCSGFILTHTTFRVVCELRKKKRSPVPTRIRKLSKLFRILREKTNFPPKKKMTTISSMVSVPNLRRLSSRKVKRSLCDTTFGSWNVSPLVKLFGYSLETEMVDVSFSRRRLLPVFV